MSLKLAAFGVDVFCILLYSSTIHLLLFAKLVRAAWKSPKGSFRLSADSIAQMRDFRVRDARGYGPDNSR